MTQAQPEIRCGDYWPHGIPKNKLRAYRVMLDAGAITRPRVVVNKSLGSVAVCYYSTIPHDWLRKEMGDIVRNGEES